MRLSKVRNYFTSVIDSYDPDFSEHKDGFNDENIPSTVLDKSYFIEYSIDGIETGQGIQTESVSVEVKFFFKGFRDVQSILDETMDITNEIKLNLVSSANVNAFRVTDGFPIQKVLALSQTPTNINSNDNSIIIALSFSAIIIQATC